MIRWNVDDRRKNSMKIRWVLCTVALLTSGALGCADTGSNEGLVARVGDYELTVADVAELLVNEERLPANVDVIHQVADLWIEYTLLGTAVSLDTTLNSIEFEPLVRQQLDQLAIFQLRDSVVQIDTLISDDELRELYSGEDAALEMRARHILIQYSANASEAERAGARAQLQSIRDRIAGGEAFESMAQQFSHDPGTAALGGDLGFFGRGDMLQPFEDAVLELQPGELSEVVETQYGLHLIRLEQRRIQNFDEIAPRFRQQVLTERFLRAESTYVADVETRAGAESVEGALEVLRELARNPGTRLSRRAQRRPVFEYVGGELTVGEVQLVLQSQVAEFRDQVVAGDNEQLENFLRGMVQREVLKAEATAAGFDAPVERVDSMIDDARAQLRGAADVLGLVSPDQAPGEPVERAIARAVLEAVGRVLTGTTEIVRLGGIEFQLAERTSAAVFDRGVGEALIRIGELRMNRSPTLLEEAADTSTKP